MTCAIYIRKSREERDKPSHRLTVQREQLPAHARAQGWQVEVYDDGHASAARGKTENLAERARLEGDIRAGKIGVVLCIELSRLSRDDSMQDYVGWLHLCSQHQVKLATPSRVLDPSQHSDWMLLLMEGGFSSVEMKVLQQRMAEGRREAFKAGKYLAGNPPPPYRYDKAVSGLIVDPEQLPKMQKLWKLAEDHSARSIAMQLDMPEIAVRRAISDKRLLLYQSLREDPESGELLPCEWEALIDADQADRIRAGRRTRKSKGVRRKAAGLLSAMDILYCGFCGRTAKTWMNSKYRADGTRLDYYGCQQKNGKTLCPQSRLIQQPILEERVVGNIFRTLQKLDDLKAYWSARQNTPDINQQLSAIEAEEKDLLEQKARLIEAVTAGALDLADVKNKKQDLESTLGAINRRRRDIVDTQAIEPDWDALRFTQEDFESLDFDEQRELVKLIIEEIKIYSGHAILTYRFPRNANGDPTARINLPAPKIKRHKNLPKSFTNN